MLEIVPARFFDMGQRPGRGEDGPGDAAMYGMTKFDVAALEQAYAGA